MAYSTVSLIRLALVPGIGDPSQQPIERSNTAGDLSNTQLQDAVTQADSMIDGYVGNYYMVPVINDANGVPYAQTPHPLDFWSRDIAAYLATLTWRKGLNLDPTDPVALRYQQTMLLLQAVAKGTYNLPIPTNTADSSGAGAGEPVNAYSGTLFPMDEFSLTYGDPGEYGPGRWWYWQ